MNEKELTYFQIDLERALYDYAIKFDKIEIRRMSSVFGDSEIVITIRLKNKYFQGRYSAEQFFNARANVICEILFYLKEYSEHNRAHLEKCYGLPNATKENRWPNSY
jgi:hypothetical protein